MSKFYKLLCFFLVLLIFSACSNKPKNIISGFDAITNFGESDTVSLPIDLDHVVLNGIQIPSARQSSDNGFAFRFDINAKHPEKYFYKIYYQNESYKFPETKGNGMHPYCSENFYGSWEDVAVGFKPVQGQSVTDTYRIVGNPRDEKKFYGGNMQAISFDEASINQIKQSIKNTPEWFESIKKKAQASNKTIDQQVFLDAVWIINDKVNHGDFNHRWKRNPRVGCYNFLLVVASEKALSQLPGFVTNIGKTNDSGAFINPFYYFKYGEGASLDGVFTSVSHRVLKTSARIDPMQGIYVNPAAQRDENIDKSYLNAHCNDDQELYKSALFEQFSHAINRHYQLRNIPEAHDVLHDPYTQDAFFGAMEKYDSSQLITDHTYNSECPCKTVKLDTLADAIILENPGNPDLNNLRKENVGVKTRVGFTYGKYRGKIKFPKQLNEENVWNGLTNAFWMIYQEGPQWNMRRAAERDGYIQKNDGGEESLNRKHKQLAYSEIDIEIVKTSPFWNGTDFRANDGRNSHDVMFCCTNWDLANQDPKNFFKGVSDIEYQGKSYTLHRWTDYYKAVTSKYPMDNEELFGGDYFYYEIEWKPTEIIWRAGPSPDKMQICGYMNDEVTSIPNNQMVCVITQEFHYAEWWPFQPFSQNWVPYPKNPIEGKVYEIIVE